MANGIYISGEWREGRGETLHSTDPAFDDVVWSGQMASDGDVSDAVSAAREAFTSWSRTPLQERIDILQAYEKQLEHRASDISEMISREVGKPSWETATEVTAMRGKVGLSITSQAERAGEKTSETAFGRAELAHRPHGVMAVFGPFNFPGHLPNGHIVPALLAGNTCVFKPSELAPGTAQLMIECFEAAGLPPGVLNLVVGARDAGAALLEADIDGLLFTGSAKTGTYFHKHFGGRPEVILALEMGGNNPLIVWDAADVNAAADIAAQSAFLTTGQRCSCARRLILPSGAFGDAVLEGVIARADQLRIGTWKDEDVFMGPLVNAAAADNALTYQETLEGLGGKSLKTLKKLDQGDAFVSPGVIDMTDATEDHDEELFGPFLQVWRVDSFESAIERANRTRFGLAGGLVSDNERLWSQAHQLMRAGILNWNRPTAGASSAMPFGGPGLSGNHRPSAWYAADYCAWPQASQISPRAERMSAVGFPNIS